MKTIKVLKGKVTLVYLAVSLISLSGLVSRTLAESTGKCDLPDHPRLILTGDFLDLTRQRCQTSRASLFDRLKKSVDKHLNSSLKSLDVRVMAQLAEKCAFVYLIGGNEVYLAHGLQFLDKLLDRYIFLEQKHGGGYWELVEFRRHCCFAYDWMFPTMTREQRKRLGMKLIQAGSIAWKNQRFAPYEGGGYGNLDPVFWPGVTMACTGVDDSLAQKWFDWSTSSLHEWCRVLRQVAANDGGMFSGMDYASYNYLRTPIFNLEIWKGLTGEDLVENNAYLCYFTSWWLYCLRPNGEWLKIDDTRTVLGRIDPWLFKYLASRYHDPVSQWYLKNRADSQSYMSVWDVIWDPQDLDIQPAGPDNHWPLARHFEGIGWVVMRSGWDSDASHALFDCGDVYYGHQHPSENSFVIFKHGSLAINSGRYEWGSNHRPNYFARSIASNTILVYDPAEKFTANGEKLLSNDGGQLWPWPARKRYGDAKETVWDTGDIIAFETHPYYSYVCGDASNAYNKNKVKSFTRQFLHVQPDMFIIFDRVEATQAHHNKYWLLHSINEPTIDGRLAKIQERKGRLFCQTVFPEDAKLQKVGDLGHEFEVFGTNYPPALTHYPKVKGEEWGAWRLEVTPGEAHTKDCFLHVLLAGDDTLVSAPEVKRLFQKDRLGVEFIYRGMSYRIVFAVVGFPCGQLMITRPDGSILIDKLLADKVQPQAGIGN